MAVMLVVAVASHGQEPVVNPLTDTGVYPIAVWAMGAGTAPAFSKMGVNIFVGGEGDDPKAWADAIAESKCVGFVHWKGRSDEARKVVASSPGFLGWMHGDEPDNAGTDAKGEYHATMIMPDVLIGRYEAMKKSSTPAPMYLNLGVGLAVGSKQSTPDHLYYEFMKCADVVCYDVYPVSTHPGGSNRLHLVARGVERLRRFAGPDKPVWIWLECGRLRGDNSGIGNRAPAPHELRAEVWMAILYGASGIGYFPHKWNPWAAGPKAIPQELRAEMKLTNRLLHKAAPILRTGQKTTLKTDAGSGHVAAAGWQKDGDLLVVAVNMRSVAAKATIQVPGAVKRLKVVGQNYSVRPTAGALVEEFKPYEVRLYTTGSAVTWQHYGYPAPKEARESRPEEPGRLADLPAFRDNRKGILWSRTHHSRVAVPRLAEAPKIDGDYSDEAWDGAETLASWSNVPGTSVPTCETTGLVGHHGGKLYFAFRCTEDFMDDLVTGRKAHWQNDCIEIFLDPDNRRTSSAHIVVTADGRVGASRLVQDHWGEGRRDDEWKPDIKAGTGRWKRGWTVEASIDLKDLGDIGKNPVWAFDVARERKPAPGENSVYTIGGFTDGFHFGEMTFEPAKVTLANGTLVNRTDTETSATVEILISAPQPGNWFPDWEARWLDLVREAVTIKLAPGEKFRLINHKLMLKIPAGGRLRLTLKNPKPLLVEEFIANVWGEIKK